MLNFDMLGRLNAQRAIVIGGTGTSVESEQLLNTLKINSKLNFTYSSEGYGPSDHASFYAANIPVLYFNTGVHDDYHTPADDVEKINFDGEKEVLDFIYLVASDLINRQTALTFQEAGPKSRPAGRRLKVTLGIMPDFASTDTNGLGVGGVRKGGPADLGGIKKGDRIVALDGKPVQDIYEYMSRLNQLKPGQLTSVDIIRDGQKIVLIIQL